MFVDRVEEVGWCRSLSSEKELEGGVSRGKANGCAISVQDRVDVVIPVILVRIRGNGQGNVEVTVEALDHAIGLGLIARGVDLFNPSFGQHPLSDIRYEGLLAVGEEDLRGSEDGDEVRVERTHYG
jgi:hypothetical protein